MELVKEAEATKEGQERGRHSVLNQARFTNMQLRNFSFNGTNAKMVDHICKQQAAQTGKT